MNERPFRLLIVGAGLTGSVAAALIKRHLPANIEINVWEKSRGIGGRMTTSRSQDGLSSVDLGAQYITRTGQYAKKHEIFFDELLHAGLLKPFPGNIEGNVVKDDLSKDFMAPQGINSVVKHFLKSSGACVNLETFCSSINLPKEGKSWEVLTKDGKSNEFHGIILTIPVPQLLKLEGNFQNCFQEHLSSLQQVQYSSRYALALYFPRNTTFEVPWTAKYVYDHPYVRFVSIDSRKRGKGNSEASLLLHTSVPFGLKHLESDIQEIEKTLHDSFYELFPKFPRPSAMRCIRWRYSQVHKPFPGQPGAVVVHSEPFLCLAGDAFVHSDFSGCIESSLTVLQKLQEHRHTSYL